MQHIQLPNNMTSHKELDPKDLLVYVTIRKHLNKDSKECYPSLACISKECEYSIPAIRKSIKVLLDKKYITIRKEGRKNVYRFSPYKNFEMFSYEFFEKKDIAANEKAYIIASQQFMIKDVEGLGKMSFTNDKLGELLNISPKTISRLDKSLEEKGYLTIVKTNKKNLETGIFINEKFFKLDELGQSIIWTLQKHEEDIEEIKNETKDIKILLSEIERLKRRVNYLEGKDNTEIII